MFWFMKIIFVTCNVVSCNVRKTCLLAGIPAVVVDGSIVQKVKQIWVAKVNERGRVGFIRCYGEFMNVTKYNWSKRSKVW